MRVNVEGYARDDILPTAGGAFHPPALGASSPAASADRRFRELDRCPIPLMADAAKERLHLKTEPAETTNTTKRRTRRRVDDTPYIIETYPPGAAAYVSSTRAGFKVASAITALGSLPERQRSRLAR